MFIIHNHTQTLTERKYAFLSVYGRPYLMVKLFHNTVKVNPPKTFSVYKTAGDTERPPLLNEYSYGNDYYQNRALTFSQNLFVLTKEYHLESLHVQQNV